MPDGSAAHVDVGTRQGRNFAPERTENAAGVFDAVTNHVQALQAAGKRVLVALLDRRLARAHGHVLSDHGAAQSASVGSWSEALGLPKPQVALAVLGLETGFETADAAVVGEQDILGDRMVRPRRASSAPRISSPRRPACRPAIWSPISSMASAAISA